MSNKKKWIIGIVVVFVVAGIIIGQITMKKDKGLAVEIAPVKIEKIVEKVTAPARIQPVTIVNISADVMGQVTELAAEEGDWVEKGQFLLRIDPAIYQSSVNRAKAMLRSAAASEELAEANLRQAELSHSRKQNLFDQDLASQEELDIAQTEVEVNKARVKSAREQVEETKATLEEARSNLKKTTISAPMAGTVSQLNIEEGETAITGTMNNPGTVLLSIADLTQMEAVAEVDETDVVQLESGQNVEVEVDALPDTILTGEVREIANTATIRGRGTDQEITNFMVKIDIVSHHAKLRPGMSSTISIITHVKEDVAAIPIQAVVMRRLSELEKENSDKPSDPESEIKNDDAVEGVFIVKEESDRAGKIKKTAHFTQIITGISSETSIEVVSGLSEGTKVITGPYRILLNLQDGSSVKKEDEKNKPKRPDKKS
ncbi:MAG: hypothetical protein B6244_14220 [Candidatus Cloacimonetes bacterium 4572_55]|nr:MAG: hypothetical protein B6244_14220 [Candidatus Cloacimonetes bacterium 4572_55]